MLSITLTRRPALASVTRGESVINERQALSAAYEPIISSDGEVLGAIIGDEQVWARAVSGSVRLGEVRGGHALSVLVNGAPVPIEQAAPGTSTFSAQKLPERRSHTITVQIRDAASGSALEGRTTLSVTATDWDTDILNGVEERRLEHDDD